MEQHVEEKIASGGFVLVLNTRADIDPEAQAMLAALHSRSIGGIKSHLEVLAEKGADNFMSKFYVGYGHKSIGDLGSVSVFIEGVSMLTAKAFQDFRLYNGQEASTRYIDFATQPFINPLRTEKGEKVQEYLRSFYLRGIKELPTHLKEKYPMQNGEKETVYEKAILARAFDIMRAFLPAGAATNLAWHGPLRIFGDRLHTLRHHPLEEVRETAAALEKALLRAHPNSFSDKRYEKTEAYLEESASLTYFNPKECLPLEITRNTLDFELLKQYENLLKNRPEKTELSKVFDEAGELQFTYLLDFGSFRDIQRHRAVVQRMPLLSTKFGFHEWYLSEMPDSLRKDAEEFIEKHTAAVAALDTSDEVKQYYTAMGFLTPNRLTGTLPGLTYLIELRSSSTVHPTLRLLAQQMGEKMKKELANVPFALHTDMSDARFDTKRGTHDILVK